VKGIHRCERRDGHLADTPIENLKNFAIPALRPLVETRVGR
jgi:hypothetical protein